MCIGPLQLDGRAFLAPMAGVTDLGMRRLARRFGAALVFSEMVAAQELTLGARESLLRAEGDGVHPYAVQIAGRDPDAMARAALIAQDAGADLVDINMGCPAKRVTGGYGGAALMCDLDLAQSLIAAVVRAVRIPVAVKMRLGWDEASHNAPELARRAEGEGAQMITVHGRTRQQFYRGNADWSAIGAVRQAIKIPLVANGDCLSLQDALAMRAASGADAVMIGRAALGQPWLVGDIASALRNGEPRAPISGDARRAAAREHYQTLLAVFGVAQGLRHARKHLAAYAEVSAREGSALPPDLRARLVCSESPEEVLGVLGRLFETPPRVEKTIRIEAA